MKTKWPTFKVLQGLGMQLSLYNYCWMMAVDGCPAEVVKDYLQSCDEVRSYGRRVKDGEISKALRDAYSDALTHSRRGRVYSSGQQDEDKTQPTPKKHSKGELRRC